MPDIFDNIFNRIGTAINGGKTTHHYQGSSQVNTGRFYSFHENGTNNKYWMPTSSSFGKTINKIDETNNMPVVDNQRMGSVGSAMSEEGMDMPRARMGSMAEEDDMPRSRMGSMAEEGDMMPKSKMGSMSSEGDK